MTNYCIACGFNTETAFIVCETCSILHDVPECFVPATCGDDVCYLQANGEINLDGESCSHEKDFYSVFDPKLMFI